MAKIIIKINWKLWFTRVIITTFIMVGALLCFTPSWAEESGGADPKGISSQEDELQKDPIGSEEQGNAMPGSIEGPSLEFQSDSMTMEEVLSLSTQEDSMESPQPPVVDTFQPEFDSGGEQTRIPIEKNSNQKENYLSLVLRISQDGSSEVLSATEMQGSPPYSDEALSDFFYEVTDGNKTLAFKGLSMNPFQAHSFGSGPGQPEEHFFFDQREATIVVHVPGKNLSSKLDNLGVQLFQLSEGMPVETLSESDVNFLKTEDRLKTIVSLSGENLASQIKAKGQKLPTE